MKRVLLGLTIVALALGCSRRSPPVEEPPSARSAEVSPTSTALTMSAEPGDVEESPLILGDGSPDNPIQVAHISDVAVDADMGDWSQIASFPMPFMKNKKSSIYLGWNEKGLYGAVAAVDDKVVIQPDLPWTGDCFELWLDKSFSRAADRDEHCVQLLFTPDPKGKEGKGLVQQVGENGLLPGPKGLECAWKKTDYGYNLEFFIPAAQLQPAKLRPGTKLGLNFALDNDGEPIYQFFHDKDTDEGYRNPSTWGAVVLK